MTMTDGVAIVSGGLDSTVLAYMLNETHEALTLVSFDYGQRHAKELDYAMLTAQALDAEWVLVDLDGLGQLLAGSALTDPSVPVPEGHYAAASMAATVVPNRNAIMLSIATGIAVARGARYVATAVHAGDHAIYPDCRPEFIAAINRALRLGTEGFCADEFEVLAPLVHRSKADIVRMGADLEVPFENTWSCYQGLTVHCGACGTCVERREAFVLAGVDDPTEYAATPEFSAP